uniref:Uncharacterized protein n=1 Tax=Fagus sylvatica TaxID=28930 RepID=A0A2N9F789_FAGSY
MRRGPSCAAQDGPCASYCSCHVAILSATPADLRIRYVEIRARVQFFDPIFEGNFGGLRFGRGELWLPEVGVSELFLCTFPDEDSGQTGDAIGEPRVPRRSRSHYLSNAPGLADQLVASRKDSAREGGSCAAYFCKVPDLRKSELGLVRYGPANRGHRGVFGPFEGSFPIGIPASPDKFLAIREFLVVHECVFFPMCPGSQINLLRVRKTLCASVATSVGKFPELSAKPYFVGLFSRAWPCTEASLGSQDMILRTEAVRNVPYAKGMVKERSVRFSFRSGQWSGQTLVKLGQPWSNLVEFGQSSPNSWEMYPGTTFRGLSGIVGPSRVRNGLVKPRSNLVNLGQTWSNSCRNLVKPRQTLGRCVGDLPWGILKDGPSSDQADLVRAVLVLRADTRENPGGTAKNLPQFACHSLSDALAVNRLTHGSKVKVGFRFLVFSQNSTFPTSAFSFPSSSDLALRKFVRLSELGSGKIGIRDLSKSQFGEIRRFGNPESKQVEGNLGFEITQAANRVVSTVWNLSPNRLRGDLTWGLPKLQIGWFQRPNRLRGDLTWELPKLQIGVVSTVWNLSPNRLRGDLTWELPKLQIGWFQRFGISVQTAANRVVSTVWNLSPNRLRGDLTWELPKLQIGWFQRFGISVQTAANRVVSTVWNLSPNRLRGDLTWELPKLQIGWFQRFGISVQTAANRVVSTVWNLSPNRLRGDLTWELPKLQIGWFQRFGISVQTAANRVVSTVWNLSPNRLRGDLTWELPKLQIGWFQRFGISVQTAANRVVSTVWNLSPNRLRGDLTWELPKLQIGWFQRFGISVQTAANRVVSTVWNLSPNRLRGDLTWELPKLQIGWFQRFGISVQTAANRVVSTVWNLSPNRLRGDLTWELPKLQIGWFQRFGISVQTAANRVVSTVWNLSPNRLRGDLTWELPKLQIGWFQRFGISVQTVYLAFLALGLPVALSCRRFTEAVVAEIVAGSHALDSCECMNIEGQILRKT